MRFKLTLEPMRSAGLSDREILDVDLIVSCVANVKRPADGLAIALEGEDDVMDW